MGKRQGSCLCSDHGERKVEEVLGSEGVFGVLATDGSVSCALAISGWQSCLLAPGWLLLGSAQTLPFRSSKCPDFSRSAQSRALLKVSLIMPGVTALQGRRK